MAKSKKSADMRQKPANDAQPRASQRLDFVTFPPPRTKRKLAASLVLAVFALILLIACAAYFARENPAAAPLPPKLVPPSPAQSFNIEIPTPADTPGEGMIVSPDTREKDSDKKIDASSFDLQISIVPPVQRVDNGRQQAIQQDFRAKEAAQRGDDRQAAQYQRRAARLDPSNMQYRLALAVLLDRVSERDEALDQYQQVIDAYQNGDPTLPGALDIEAIRRRAAYLSSVTER